MRGQPRSGVARESSGAACGLRERVRVLAGTLEGALLVRLGRFIPEDEPAFCGSSPQLQRMWKGTLLDLMPRQSMWTPNCMAASFEMRVYMV